MARSQLRKGNGANRQDRGSQSSDYLYGPMLDASGLPLGRVENAYDDRVA
jgi:hypothetical protein